MYDTGSDDNNFAMNVIYSLCNIENIILLYH